MLTCGFDITGVIPDFPTQLLEGWNDDSGGMPRPVVPRGLRPQQQA